MSKPWDQMSAEERHKELIELNAMFGLDLDPDDPDPGQGANDWWNPPDYHSGQEDLCQGTR